MNIRKAMKIRDSMNSEVKLTKAGEKYSKVDSKDIDTLLKKSTDISKLNLNEIMGLSVNPSLSSAQITTIFELLKKHNDAEKASDTKGATRTKNMGIREKIRKQLSLHKNIPTEAIKTLLYGARLGTPAVLNNSNITQKDLDEYFEKKVMTTAQGIGYNFVSFGELIQTDNITPSIALGWYNQLKKYADWNYKDNQWYAIVDAYLEYPDCPVEILEDIVELTVITNKDEFFNRSVRYIKSVVEHKNSNDDLKLIAYEKTQDEEFLPDTVKEVFLF